MHTTRRILLFFVGLLLILIGTFHIHQNFNRGQYIGGHGMIKVESCSPSNEDYECLGFFTQYGGMVGSNNAAVKVGDIYKNGDYIDDIWSGGGTYMTGAKRRSLFHNAPAAVSIGLGALLLVVPLTRKMATPPLIKS